MSLKAGTILRLILAGRPMPISSPPIAPTDASTAGIARPSFLQIILRSCPTGAVQAVSTSYFRPNTLE